MFLIEAKIGRFKRTMTKLNATQNMCLDHLNRSFIPENFFSKKKFYSHEHQGHYNNVPSHLKHEVDLVYTVPHHQR